MDRRPQHFSISIMRFLLLATVAAATAIPPTSQATAELAERALPNSPSGGYAPQVVDCPQSRPKIRSASSGLSPEESKWLEQRRKATVRPMTDFLKRAGIKGFDADAFMSRAEADVANLPNVAIAVSGGGYRALMNGAGFLAAADDRTPGSTAQGKGSIGGLLQSATYLAGLSGGGWLVGSMFTNNFSSVQELRSNQRVWKFDRSLLEGPAAVSGSAVSRVLEPFSYWTDILNQVSAKRRAGFDTSLTDYWGRALGYQLVDAKDGGPAYTFSSIAQSDSFKSASTPFPFIVADGRAPGSRIINLNSTVFEFGPFELGTWDPTAYGFAPLEYVGSNFSAGAVPEGGSDNKCVRGFDSASFVMGTSSSLFNQFLLQNITSAGSGIPQIVLDALRGVAAQVDSLNNDIASYKPNPFLGYNPQSAGGLAASAELSLVDGGSDGQNIPLQPLIQPARKVDVVFAVDSSADTKYNWPDGFALRATYDRSLGRIANGTAFPAVPDQATFLARGLNNRPTFFGCDVANLTSSSSSSPRPGQPVPPPLVVYLPNAPYTAMPNVSTLSPSYAPARRDDIIVNGYNMATQGNGTLDRDWPACVACAVVHRSLVRASAAVPPQCADCFAKYCWDGKLVSASGGGKNNNASTNPDLYEPAFKVSNQTTDNGDESKSAGFAALRVVDRGLVGSLVAFAVLAAVA
ncbi:lysophospholipase Plb3 [Gaeumannomyces tritici R3-111a-1]|uniref:Lysophospholipase n=1 Tax=Gaeumannomyces tritici (strain R3-111a-1) TaxID=644352 RepID=J3P2N3_GAET3|nr:lysophospholipase Plb3 [Gaeumannomyces tritici R3-111a-1]EJT73925.1 lysophospholipase Plb3 [Gaeumannomyces tritici R3-111a-1]